MMMSLKMRFCLHNIVWQVKVRRFFFLRAYETTCNSSIRSNMLQQQHLQCATPSSDYLPDVIVVLQVLLDQPCKVTWQQLQHAVHRVW